MYVYVCKDGGREKYGLDKKERKEIKEMGRQRNSKRVNREGERSFL